MIYRIGTNFKKNKITNLKSQEYDSLEDAIIQCDKCSNNENMNFKVFDNDNNIIYSSPKDNNYDKLNTFKPYIVSTPSNLVIRTSPENKSENKTGRVTGGLHFCIIEEKIDNNGDIWGMIESTNEWISLKYCEKI